MKRSRSKPKVLLVVGCLTVLMPSFALAQQNKSTPLAHQYGFMPPEIYKLDQRTRNVLARDLNNDGKTDLIVHNPLKNRIDILLQRKPGETFEPELAAEANELVSDARMRLCKLKTDRMVYSFEVADMNNDKLVDLAYLGEPSGLHILYQKKDGNFDEDCSKKFGNKKSFEIPNLSTGSWTIEAGDLNGDGRNDLAFLGKEHLLISYQDANGQMQDPIRFKVTGEGASLVRILDLNGDSRNDVVLMTDDAEFPLTVRFQTASKKLGPARRLSIEKPRGVAYYDLDGKPGVELLYVSDSSERFLVAKLADADTEDQPPTSDFLIYPIDKQETTRSVTDLVSADFDGDQKNEVLVTDSGSSKVTLYRNSEVDGLDSGTSYPAMQGISQLKTLSIGKKLYALMLSEKENLVGVSHFDGSRMTYPSALPVQDEVLAFESAGSGDTARLYYVSRSRASGKEVYSLRALQPKVEQDKVSWSSTTTGGDKQALELPLSAKPIAIRSLDLNQDKQLDLVLFFEFSTPQALLASKTGGYESAPVALSLLGSSVPPASLASTDGAILYASGNSIRRLVLDGSKLAVKDAINISDASAKLVGVQPIDVDGDKSLEIAAYDRTSGSVILLKQKDGVYREWKTVKAGQFSLRGMLATETNNDGKPDLVLMDADKFAITFSGKQDQQMKTIASYDTAIRNGRLVDNVPGDLNSDGKPDVLLMEDSKNALEIASWQPDNKLKTAIFWQVFEKKTFSMRGMPGQGLPEPREAVIADLDGDDRNDIAILVHNRVLIYLQDSTEKSSTEKNEPKPGPKDPTATDKGSR